MRQVLFEIPGLGVPIFGYGLMLVVALISAVACAQYRARRAGLDVDILMDMTLWMVMCGLLGARIFFVAQYWRTFESPWEWFEVWRGGIVLYGGILGGAFGFFLYRAFREFPILITMDVVAPSLALGIGFGRFGCFLNGCCYGDRSDWFWAVRFPEGSIPWIDQVRNGLIAETASCSLPLHPTQLYSSIDGFLLFFLTWTFFPLRRRPGEVFALLMITYPISRFLIEYLRNDEHAFFEGFTISQNLSFLFWAIGIGLWFVLPKGALTVAPSESDGQGQSSSG